MSPDLEDHIAFIKNRLLNLLQNLQYFDTNVTGPALIEVLFKKYLKEVQEGMHEGSVTSDFRGDNPFEDELWLKEFQRELEGHGISKDELIANKDAIVRILVTSQVCNIHDQPHAKASAEPLLKRNVAKTSPSGWSHGFPHQQSLQPYLQEITAISAMSEDVRNTIEKSEDTGKLATAPTSNFVSFHEPQQNTEHTERDFQVYEVDFTPFQMKVLIPATLRLNMSLKRITFQVDEASSRRSSSTYTIGRYHKRLRYWRLEDREMVLKFERRHVRGLQRTLGSNPDEFRLHAQSESQVTEIISSLDRLRLSRH